jgi:hypothetical protein
LNTFKATTIESLKVTGEPVDPTDVVRLQDLQEETSGIGSHTHPAADITDWEEAVDARVAQLVRSSYSITVGYDAAADELSGEVRIRVGGGLSVDADGLGCDFGSGEQQVPRGNHSHAQLHDAVTVADTDTVDLSLAGQQVSGSVKLATASALKVVSGQGLAVDLGEASGQAAAGNHTHAQLHAPLTKTNSTSVAITLNGQELTAEVVVDPAPPSSHGRLIKGAYGLYAELGAESGQAARGNHTHAAATTSVDGFLSAADKVKLDSLPPGVVLDEEGGDSRYTLREGLAPGEIYVGDESGIARGRAVYGDIELDLSGQMRIVDGAVDDAAIGDLTVNESTTYPMFVTAPLSELLSWTAKQIKEIIGSGSWSYGVTYSLVDAQAHAIDGTNPHGTSKTDVGLGNVANKAQVPLDGTNNMTGPLKGATRVVIGGTTEGEERLRITEASSAVDNRILFVHGSTSRLEFGVAGGADELSGQAAAGDGYAKLLTANASLWVVDAGGNARFRGQTQVNGGAGSAWNVHYANGLPAVRAVVAHAGNSGGYSSLGGVQFVAQGANQSTAGSGGFHFFTPTANSAGAGTDATVAARLSILQDGKIGFGISAPTVAFHFVNDGGVMRVPVKSTTGDPSGGNGDVYYNTADGVFRFHQNGAWTGMGGAGGVAGTAGQLQFNSGSGFGADTNLVWDSVNDRLAIGKAAANFTLDVAGTVRITGTNALRFGGSGSGDYTASIQSAGGDQLDISNNVNLASGKVFRVNGTQLIASAPATGWSNAGTFTPTRGDINSGSITLAQLADRVATMVTDLKYHGLFSTS